MISLRLDRIALLDQWADHETEVEPLPGAVCLAVGSDYPHERQTRVTFTQTESTDEE